MAATAFWSHRPSRSSGRRRCRCSKSQPGFAEAFMPGGRAPKPGERFAFPDHAATLEQIAATNGEAFYRGELAAKLEAHATANGGVMRADDLAAHRADWVGTISRTYRGYTLHEIPPNGQGIVALIALGILEQFDMSALPADSADSVHLQIEALKLAFADAQAYVADIDHMPLRPEHLLDNEYLKHRATLIDRKRAKPANAGTPKGGTVYLTAADASGMMVSMIQSNYMGFGSGVVVGRHRHFAAESRRGFRCGSGTSEPGRAEQAPLPHDHSGLCYQGRGAGDELRGDGRHHATPGACPGAGAHRRPRPESAGGVRRPALPLGATALRSAARRVFRSRPSTNSGSAGTTWSPWTTTTSSAAARRFGASTAGILRRAIRAATVRRRVSEACYTPIFPSAALRPMSLRKWLPGNRIELRMS